MKLAYSRTISFFSADSSPAMVKGYISNILQRRESVSYTHLVAYLTICFIGIPFITAYNVISSIFRGLGDSKSPMYFIAVACVANIGLDYLFMGAMRCV